MNGSPLATTHDRLESFTVQTGDGLELRMRRLQPRAADRGAVLLLHGANTNGDSFLHPDGGLAGWLAAGGHDVWILDWRGSREVVDRFKRSHADRFTFDAVAHEDLPAALRAIRACVPEGQIAVVGHCMGGASTAMALGAGLLEPFGVGPIALLAAGLYLSAPTESLLKAQDGILERTWAEDRTAEGTDPNDVDAWPAVLRRALDLWPRSLLPQGSTTADAVFRHASFMYGRPYRRSLVPDDVHERAPELFGLLHFGLFRHAVQSLRRGYMAPFGAPENGPEAWRAARTYFRPESYADKRLFLLTGRHNALWHPDSLARFDEWLRADTTAHVTRHVLPDYGHQDMLWGASAHHDVFPLLQRFLQ